MTFAERVRELEDANARLLAENAGLRARLEMPVGNTKWDRPASETVGAGNVANWSLRMWAKNRRQERDDDGLAAYIGCTVEELRRETAVGWLAPLQDEIARLTAELAAAQAELSALKDAIDATEAAYPLDIWPEPGPSSIDHEFWTRRVELAAASMARRTCRNIRSALDENEEATRDGA